jgi:hypothetical protein
MLFVIFSIKIATSITAPFVELVACECNDSCTVLSHAFYCLSGHAFFQHLPPVTHPLQEHNCSRSILRESLNVNSFIQHKLPVYGYASSSEAHSLFRTKSFDFSNLPVLILSGTGIDEELMLALAEMLHNATALKQLDLSANPNLRLLPVGMLQIAASLKCFKYDEILHKF